MYSIKNLFTKNPIQISGAVVAVMNVPILSGAWDLSAEEVSGVNIAIVLVLGLFVRSTTINEARLVEAQSAADTSQRETIRLQSDSGGYVAKEYSPDEG